MMDKMLSEIETRYLEVICNRLQEQGYYGLDEITIVVGGSTVTFTPVKTKYIVLSTEEGE